MKKVLLIFGLVLFALVSMAQSRGSVITVTPDTVQGAETIYFDLGRYTAASLDGTLQFDALCTQLGGTSDGTMEIQSSLDDTNWVTINGVGGGILTASPLTAIADTTLNVMTITDGLVGSWIIKDVGVYFRMKVVGTASDTTLISPKRRYK